MRKSAVTLPSVSSVSPLRPDLFLGLESPRCEGRRVPTEVVEALYHLRRRINDAAGPQNYWSDTSSVTKYWWLHDASPRTPDSPRVVGQVAKYWESISVDGITRVMCHNFCKYFSTKCVT